MTFTPDPMDEMEYPMIELGTAVEALRTLAHEISEHRIGPENQSDLYDVLIFVSNHLGYIHKGLYEKYEAAQTARRNRPKLAG